jgi:hypothetical protein
MIVCNVIITNSALKPYTDKRQKPNYDLRYRQKINTDDALYFTPLS